MLLLLLFTLLFSFLNVATSTSFDLGQVAFVILSQSGPRHEPISAETRLRLTTALNGDGVTEPQVFDLINDFPGPGGWTIFPLLPLLDKVARPETKWFAFLHETTEVNPELLREVLSRYESDYGIFLGRALREQDNVFPDSVPGFLISKDLFDNLLVYYEEGRFSSFLGVVHDGPFFVSAASKHLASFLEDDARFCVAGDAENCAMYPREVPCKKTTEDATR